MWCVYRRYRCCTVDPKQASQVEGVAKSSNTIPHIKYLAAKPAKQATENGHSGTYQYASAARARRALTKVPGRRLCLPVLPGSPHAAKRQMGRSKATTAGPLGELHCVAMRLEPKKVT